MNLSKPHFDNIKTGEEPTASRSILRSAYVEHRLSGLYELGKWTECRYWLRGLNDTYRIRIENGTAKPLPPRAPADAEFLLRAPLRMILAHIGENHPQAPFLRRYAQGLEQAVAEAASRGLDFGLCHGDMHGNNNALRKGDCFTHFDFEFAAPGWRAWDLAQFKNRKRQQHDRVEPLWQAFLESYRSVRAFSAEDEAAVEIFRLVRRFWTMGLDAEIAPLCDGALDFGEDWLAEFTEEFRRHPLGEAADNASA